jgi:hypothetical protein
MRNFIRKQLFVRVVLFVLNPFPHAMARLIPTVPGFRNGDISPAPLTLRSKRRGPARRPHPCPTSFPAFQVARENPPPGVSPDEAIVAVENVRRSIGDTCPECPPETG